MLPAAGQMRNDLGAKSRNSPIGDNQAGNEYPLKVELRDNARFLVRRCRGMLAVLTMRDTAAGNN
jgi:hypothetical protein